ncbi:MAG: peptidoglycan-binding domain-containing protein [Alphaproteobacteria bacterium]
MLSTLGYAPGCINGKLGSETRDAIRNYQMRMDIAATGVIDAQLLRSLGVKACAKNYRVFSESSPLPSRTPSLSNTVLNFFLITRFISASLPRQISDLF